MGAEMQKHEFFKLDRYKRC